MSERQVSDEDRFTFATSKLAAAAIVAASFRVDAVPAQNLGFMGTAYSATHEATELILKIYLERCLSRNPRRFRDHHLGTMFDAWSSDDRDSAELAYQRKIRDELFERFDSSDWVAAGVDPRETLPPDFYDSHTDCGFRVEGCRNQSLGHTLSGAQVVRGLDDLLDPPNINELCGSYATLVPGYPRAPEHVYTSEFLGMKWKAFCVATEKQQSLGLIGALLHREGSNEIYQGWRYLAEGRLEALGETFHGPPGRMITVAQCLESYVWDRLESSTESA